MPYISNVASNFGGNHYNEQDLSPLQLSKYFLTIGALIQRTAIFSDPLYELGVSDIAKLKVNLSELDKTATFAINWTGQQAKELNLVLKSPDSSCHIPLQDHQNLKTRKGGYYQLIRVQLPYRCSNGSVVHDGEWSILAKVRDMKDERGIEKVNIMVMGDSQLNLVAEAFYDSADTVTLAANFKKHGKILHNISKAHILTPLPDTGDSLQQGKNNGVSKKKANMASLEKDKNHASKLKLHKTQSKLDVSARTKEIRFDDNGNGNDKKARDGIYTATLKTADLEPGLHQARVVATTMHDDLELSREAIVSFYVGKK